MPEAEVAPVASPSTPAPVKARFEIPVFADEVAKPDAPEAPAPAAAESDPKVAQDTGEQATPAKPEGEKPDSEKEVTPELAAKRQGRRFERKLDKAIRRAAEAQAKAELLEKQLAEVQKPQAPSGEPKLEQFDYDPEKYAAAKAEHAKSQAQKEFEAKQRTEAGQQEAKQLLSSWEEKAERGADKYPDWEEKVGDLQPTNPVLASIMEADNGDDVAHYLASHAKEAARIAQLPPRQAVFQLGLLAAKLSAQPEKPKAPSKAPAPITPLTGTAAAASPEPSESDDMATWIKKRQKQVHGKR